MTADRPVRKKTPEVMMVINSLTGESIGRIGNVSERGVMLITDQPIPEGSVLQIQLMIPAPHGTRQRVELGIQCLWRDRANTERSYWNGCRIVAASREDENLLRHWLDRLPAS
jgi:hypothetical protein